MTKHKTDKERKAAVRKTQKQWVAGQTSMSIPNDLAKRLDAAMAEYNKPFPFKLRRPQFIAALITHWEVEYMPERANK